VRRHHVSASSLGQQPNKEMELTSRGARHQKTMHTFGGGAAAATHFRAVSRPGNRELTQGKE